MLFDANACKATTLAYFEHWLGEAGCLAANKGSQQIFSSERNTTQTGYPSPMSLYVWIEPSRTIISYGDAAAAKIPALVEKLRGDVFDMAEVIGEVFDRRPKHAVKYVYRGAPPTVPAVEAKTLTAKDYADYEAFFLAAYPGSNVDWLREYFNDMVQNQYCAGVYADGLLVSCADAPSMPYLPDKVQEIGIVTLDAYRGRGYASAACRQAAENIVQGGRYPIWSHAYKNAGSRMVAESVGFVKLADVLTL
ncbi:MAG: GNAT family N-acetyltransferase [Defluviitaleaceae bacterium]|nr:GNAT family N-acetyltransferase [Defluviitaleaceae bacterium]